MRKSSKECIIILSLLSLFAMNSYAVVITQIGIEPSPAFNTAPLRCYAKAVSLNNKYLSISFTWYLNGERVREWDVTLDAVNDTLAYSNLSIPVERLSRADSWMCSVYAYDSFYASNWINSSSTFINQGCGILDADTNLTADIESNATCFIMNKNNTILDCRGHSISGLDRDETYGVYVESKNNITIKNCIIKHYDSALLLNSSSAIFIHNSTLSENNIGLFLEHSTNNTLEGNVMDGNSNAGLLMVSSDKNQLDNNSFRSNKKSGISLDNSTFNILENNDIFSNLLYGILISSDSNMIKNNKISSNNKYGVYLSSSTNNTFLHNSINDNSLAGISLYLSSSEVMNNNITGNNYGILLESSQNNQIDGNNLAYNSIGLLLNSSEGNNLTGNMVKENSIFGINLVMSNKNQIKENEINSSPVGIYSLSSSNNFFYSNEVSLNNVGIYLNTLSNENSIFMNSLNMNMIGINLGVSSFNVIANSTLNSKNQDLHSEFYSNNTILNSSFNRSKIYNDETSSIMIKWYLSVRALVNGKPTQGVRIEINDVNSSVVSAQLTDSNGLVETNVSQFTAKNSSLVNHNPHKITAVYQSSKNSISTNVNSSKGEEISLTLRIEEKPNQTVIETEIAEPAANTNQIVAIIITIIVVNVVWVFIVFKPILFKKKKKDEFE